MALYQLTVFLENRPGCLLEVTETLRDAGVDIRALSIAETPDYGLLRLIVDDFDKAADAIRATGKMVKKNHVIGVKIATQSGGLVELLTLLKENNINVEYMYAFVSQEKGFADVALRVSDREKAEALLAEKNFAMIN